MKSIQLLSVVFSLIMFTGVTAGNTAFLKPSEFVTVSISPDGSKLAGVMELDDRDKVAVINLKTMQALYLRDH